MGWMVTVISQPDNGTDMARGARAYPFMMTAREVRHKSQNINKTRDLGPIRCPAQMQG